MAATPEHGEVTLLDDGGIPSKKSSALVDAIKDGITPQSILEVGVGFGAGKLGDKDLWSVPPGAQWADPDIGHAADCLRRLASDAGLRARLRTKARERAEYQFSLDRFRDVAAGLLG